MKPLLLYNLFPALFKDVNEWIKNIDRIKYMGFNAVYINPFHYPGFSGSLYAVKDYYRYNDLFFTKEKPAEEQLKDFINECKKKEIDVYMDLVINHTSIDSIIINEHKEWYKYDEYGKIINPGTWEDGKWITWGDLASFDLENSKNKYQLWDYLLEMARYYLRIGFKGFRCDAAYQVNMEFWKYFIAKLRKEFPDLILLAETLGCTPVQIKSVTSCGFNYIFNSSKWWNFNDSWCLEQYDITRFLSFSISFPETHDTKRLMDEVNSNINLFLQRIYFEAVFSKGFMITTGLEFGFKERINAVKTRYTDWENTGMDFSEKIRNILSIKNALSPLRQESCIKVVDQSNWINVFCFIKEWENNRVFICINKDCKFPQNIYLDNLEDILKTTKIKDYSPEDKLSSYIKDLNIMLKPCELKIFAGENLYNS